MFNFFAGRGGKKNFFEGLEFLQNMENESLTSLLVENLDIAALEQLMQSRRSSTNENSENQADGSTLLSQSVEFDKESFIEELRTLTCLWDTSLPSYKDRTIKANAWKKLSNIFDKDVEFLQRQLKNLKDCLKKCLDKRARMTRSGAAASSLPTCGFFEQMAFLHHSVGNRPTESNLSAVLPPPAVSSPPEVMTSQFAQAEDAPSTPRTPKLAVQPGDKRPLNAQLFTTNRSGNRMNRDAAELMLLKHLSDNDAMSKKMAEEDDDEDSLYCRSLVPIFKGLQDKK